MCGVDLRAFNKNWLSQYFSNRLPVGIIQHLPAIAQAHANEDDCLNLAEAMLSTFIAPAMEIEDLERWRDAESILPASQGALVGDILVQKLFLEWLHLARIASLKVQQGDFMGLIYLHLNLDEVTLLANLNNTQINKMAALAAVERIEMFRWAWPKNVFSATKVIHKNVFNQWAFGLAA